MIGLELQNISSSERMVEREIRKSKHLPRQYPQKLQRGGKDRDPLQNDTIKVSSASNCQRTKCPKRETVGSKARPNAPRRDTPSFSRSNSLATIPMAGAVLVGTCLGGPVGFLAGLKIGAFVGVGGSLLGYSTANMVEEQW